jgi:hypothetical protein
MAQNTYQDLLVGQFSEPWSNSQQALAESIEILNRVEIGLVQISDREQSLLKAKADLGTHGYSAQTFFNEIVKMVEENRPQEMRGQMIQIGTQKAQAFFQEFENLNRDTFDLTMALVYHQMRATLAEHKWSSKDSSALKKKWMALERSRLAYSANRDQFKKGKDAHRTTPFLSFFVKAKDLNEFILSRGTLTDRAKYQLNKLKKIWEALKLLPVAYPGLKKLIGQIFNRTQPTSDHNPVIATVNEMATKVAKSQGSTFEIDGAELLPPKNPPAGEVNVHISNHRDGLLDQAAMAALGFDHVTPYAAVNNFVPEALNAFFGFKFRVIRHLNANYALIVVGKGADPKAVPKTIEILLKSNIRNFMIYPEGRLPEGLGTMAGVRDDFFSEKGAIHAMESQGFKVNLVVTSLIDNARLFDGPSLTSENSKYRIKVHGVIRDEIRKEFMKHAGEAGLSMLLQYGLIESLVTNDRLMFGQVRPSKIKTVVLEEYVLGKSCRASVGN